MSAAVFLAMILAGAGAFLTSQHFNKLPDGLEYVTVEGARYAVRSGDEKQDRAEFLHRVHLRNQRLIDYLKEKHPDDERVKRLIKATPELRQVERASSEAGYTENKGEAIALCLSDEVYEDKFEALYFVMLHELAHVANDAWGHGPEFWVTFDFIQESAIKAGVYEYEDYSENSVQICSFSLTQNPCETCADL